MASCRHRHIPAASFSARLGSRRLLAIAQRHARHQSQAQWQHPWRCLAAAAGGGASARSRLPAAASSENASAADRGSVLFLSSVWPEPSSSAAGVRTADLLASFQRRGWAAAFACASAPNEHTAGLAAAGVATHPCPPNREAALAAAVSSAAPTAVIFDRFYAEEAYSFRVRELAPAAMRVLDMQDFHALRACRQRLAEAGAPPAEVLAALPDADSPECLRELASIHRSDLTLVCSPVELDLLTRHYGIPPAKLALAPFFAPPSPYDTAAASTCAAAGTAAAAAGAVAEAAAANASVQTAGAAAPAAAEGASPSFHARRNFLMIGNWRHPPNLDSARWACSELWPAIKAALPAEEGREAQLHLYGAYPAGAAQQLHRPKDGVHMKGHAPTLDIMLSYRVLLAPLRYGAGLKGKVVDAWWHGLPVVTTPLGAEGMTAADACASDLAASGLAAAGGQAAGQAGAAAAAPDPAAEGFVWQQGGEASGNGSSNANSSSSEGEPWGGLCGADTAAGLATSAALLYTSESLWQGCQGRGFELLRLLYDRERNLGRVHKALAVAARDLEERRRRDVVGGMLWSQQLRATEYFSRWIELKEGLKAAARQPE